MKKLSCALGSTLYLLSACQSVPPSPLGPIDLEPRVVPVSQVAWSPLNPARGDAGPQAGQLWGDRTQRGPSGFLVSFRKGFASPPHIHNVSYRGIVIAGQVHNDDPDAQDQWLPKGSYWTQPKGGVHITSAQGATNLAYIEIEDGPYLVHPPEEAFESGEVPINVDPSHHVWLNASDIAWNEEATGSGAQIALLWGQPHTGELHGSLLRLPQGFDGELRSEHEVLQGVVIEGSLEVSAESAESTVQLPAGSAVRNEWNKPLAVRAPQGEGTTLYVRTRGPYRVIPSER